MQFLWTLLRQPWSRPLRAYQWSHVALAAVVVAEPGLRWNVAVVRWWELWVLPLLAGVTVWVVRRARRGDPRARALAAGIVALAVAFLWDIARGRDLVGGPPLGPGALLLLALAMAAAVAERLRSAHRDLARLHGELESRVAERTTELRAAREAAEAASRAKSDFLANMTHEIRTPMAGMIGLIELLDKCDLGPVERGYLAALRSSSASLEGVVGDILDFSQIEAGHLKVRAAAFSPREMVAAIAELFAPLARDKGLELKVEVDPEVPARATSDPARLRQVLANLVRNAVKFTDRGAVRVEVRRAFDAEAVRLRCVVSDTGRGIDERTATRLFRPFSQGQGTADRRHGGTGLGLVISRRIVERLGGEMGFDSAPGTGSRFWFEVPVDPVVAAEPAAEPVVAVAVRSAAANGRDDRTAWSLLVAEDDDISRLVVTRLLESLGHRVVAVDGGQAALAALERERFDLVFLDCQMPGLDGYETARQLREREGGASHTPVVALTAHAVQGDRERCLAAGMDDYVTKPATRERLAQTLELWLGQAPAPPIAAATPPGPRR
jgi:signal transduction histidine kinase/ActR/RegA family two-component response regulator